ncbi:MAG: HNH endonuclease [Selenomonadaceae bacterium]|nr:HNH endonuclease [Selenomonadaceae bacterium]
MTQKNISAKKNCSVIQLGYNQYLDGSAIRQDFLETALKWISARDGIKIEDYMAQNQDAPNCNDIWLYFKKVMDWVKATFIEYRVIMKKVEWGILYNKYGEKNYDTKKLEAEIVKMLEDEDVTSSRGIYEYLFDGDERHLSIRKFSDKIKRAVYESQNKCCAKCGKHYPFEKMHADHIKPWSKDGHTTIDNCQVLCENCNRIKSDV